MLKLENICMAVNNSNGDSKDILSGINVEFKPGRVYAVTGPNGGGKTSIAKVIMGIYKQCSGRVIFNGEDISDLDVSERARKKIIYAFQHPPRFKGISVEDLIKTARPGIDNITIRTTMRDVGLCPEEYLDRDVGQGLSGGEIKRIEIAQILVRDAVVSILDEPEAGVDLWTIQQLIGIVFRKFRKDKNSLAIIITHNERLLHLCDEVIVVENGLIKVRGTPDKIWPLIKDDLECKMKEQCGREVAYEI